MTDNIPAIVAKSRECFRNGCVKTYEQRKELLESLLRFITDHEQDFIETLVKDLRKSKTESLSYEIRFARNEIINALNNLRDWMKNVTVSKPIVMLGKDVYIRHEPVGVVLIIGAWNYPIQLVLQPLIGAIAAGNTAVMKPSELSPATAEAFAKYLPKYLDQDCFPVITGGVPVATALLEQRFDHIMYTGGPNVAKIIMTAAAKYLTPVTLELGGKCPVFVDKNCNLNTAARRITWGRYGNCGQTCIAPDYVMCEREVQDEFVKEMKSALLEFYGENVQDSKDYGRIVNDQHFKRVSNLLSCGKVVIGGQTDQQDRYIAPTVLVDVKADDAVMLDEVFGPVLPIMNVSGVEEAVNYVNNHEKPLAMYVFSKSKSLIENVLERTSSGGFTGNDTLLHAGVRSFEVILRGNISAIS